MTEETNSFLVSPTAGFYIRIKLHENWYFESDVMIENKGNRYRRTYMTDSSLVNNTWQTNVEEINLTNRYFIHFPQKIQFSIPLDKKRKHFFFFEAGPYFAYLLAQKTVFILNNEKNNLDSPEDLDELIRCFDWGGIVGTGYLFKLWKGELEINITYNHSLQSFLTPDNPLKTSDTKAFYNVLAVTIGYSLPVINKSNN
jgi:hypothetical protein